MDKETSLDTLLDLPDDAVEVWIEEHRDQIDEDLVAALRARAEEVGHGGDLEGALRILDRARAVAETLNDPLPMGIVWRGRASVLQRHDRFEESLTALEEATALYERYGTSFDIAVARTGKVYVLGALERFDEAIALAHQIRPIFAQEGFVRGEAYLAHNLAQVYMLAWQLKAALREHWQARRLFLQLGDTTMTARVLHDMGVVADQMDRLNLAQRWYKRAYPIFVASGNTFFAVKIQYNLALLCLRQGQYEEALARLAQARADLSSLPDPPDKAYVDLFEARVRRALDQRDQAQTLLEQALATFEGKGRRIESAEVLVELAHLLAERFTSENLAQGLGYLERAEAYLQDLDVPLLLAATRLEQGEFLLRLQRALEAAEQVEAAHSAFAEAELNLRRAQAEALLGDCLWRLEPENAARWYRSALEGAKEDVPLLAARCWRGLGRLAAAAGDIDEAEQAYGRAVTLLNTVRRSLHGHSHQAGFLEGRQDLSGELLAALHTRCQGEQRVLAWIERFKAAALADLLSGQPPDSQTDVELAGLLAERERLRSELDRQTAFLETGIDGQTGQRGPALAARDAHGAETLSNVRRRLQELEERIARRHDAAYEWREGAAIDPSGVHRLLDERTVLVSFYTAAGQLCALTATQIENDLRIHPLGVSLNEIERRWQQTRRSVTRPTARVADVQARLAYFWNALIAPLERRLRGRDRLLILPYRGLFHIPFAGLYDAESRQYLVQQWAVQLAPSATVLERCRQRAPGTKPPLLAGFPGQPGQPGYLPGVEQEIQALASILPSFLGKSNAMSFSGKRPTPVCKASLADGRFGPETAQQGLGSYPKRRTGRLSENSLPDTEILFGEQVTVAGLMAAAPGRALVHLAGHAFYDSSNPLESGMPLAGGRWLRASDLYLHHNRLAGATVVLSGCSAGRGRPTGGDVLGLNSAFLYAGAVGMIAGLWRVDDTATAELMTVFYRELGGGVDSAAALRQAQLELLHGGQYAHPYFWAALALSGDSRVLVW